MDLSKIETGQEEINSITFELDELANQLIDIYQFSAQKNRLKLTLTYDKALPKLAISDPVKIKQIEYRKYKLHEWYDDGAIGVENTIACLEDESQFRKQLKQIEPELFEETLTNALSPLLVNELTFSLVIRLPEIEDCPHLMPVLSKMARAIPKLSVYDKKRLLRLAAKHGVGELCYKLFRRDLMNGLLRAAGEHGRVDVGLVSRISNYNPSDSLRVLKKIGSYWGGHWQEHLYKDTAKVGVASLEGLGRKRQAEVLAERYGV